MDALNQLIETLSKAGQPESNAAGDAIDQELKRRRRTTSVQSLRDNPVVEQFRQELSDGLIRVDTAHQLLSLINEVITRLL